MYRRTMAMIRKEFIQIWRDRLMLVLVMIIPVINLIIFGYAINMVVDHTKTVVLDQTNDRRSREFVEALEASTMFNVVGTVEDTEAVLKAIDASRARVGVVIPPDFSRDQDTGRIGQVQVLIDGTDGMVTQAALQSTVAVGQNYGGTILGTFLQSQGLNTVAVPTDVRPTLLYNPGMESIRFVLPGLVGMLIQTQALALTCMAVVRERERGTMEQLIVTPVRSAEILTGKVVPYLVLTLINMVEILVIARILFNVEVAGSMVLLFALSIIFMLGSLGTGILISTVSETNAQATQLMTFVLLPSFLLTGFVFPRDNMPQFFQFLGNGFALTYYMDVVRGIMLKAVGLEDLWQFVLPMALVALVMFALSVFRFRKVSA